MMVIANYRNEITLKSPVFKYMVFFLVIAISTLTATIGNSQVLEVADSLKVDSLRNKTNKKLISNDSIQRLQTLEESSNKIEPSKKAKKTPAKATLYSMILPGLGQTYNGNYWKVPIIYSLFAGMYFLYEENNYNYKVFKKAYQTSLINQDIAAKNEKLPPEEQVALNPVEARFEDYKQSTLLQMKDKYKRNRDFNIIIGVLIYGLNILDANVDAHLMDYDISPDLSINVQPVINNFIVDQNYSNKPGFGLKFVLSLH